MIGRVCGAVKRSIFIPLQLRYFSKRGNSFSTHTQNTNIVIPHPSSEKLHYKFELRRNDFQSCTSMRFDNASHGKFHSLYRDWDLIIEAKIKYQGS